MRLYHPALDREATCPDSPRLAAVMAESGWVPATDPASGKEPEPKGRKAATKPEENN